MTYGVMLVASHYIVLAEKLDEIFARSTRGLARSQDRKYHGLTGPRSLRSYCLP